jgi:hypothetical protein
LAGGGLRTDYRYGISSRLTRRLSHLSLALICSRLLASTTDLDISRRACALLREVRNATYQWLFAIRKKLESTQDETTRADLQDWLCMLAATCFSTFDVCPEYIPTLLADDEDFSIAMQCATIVHDNAPPSVSGTDPYLTRMLRRHCRLLHDLELIFRQPDPADAYQTRLRHGGAYNHALSQLSLGLRCSSSWHILPSPNSRWISCRTEEGQKVHYDLLTGQLLVNGKQLGRLPQEIVEHPTYASLFGAVSGQSQFSTPFSSFPKVFTENFRCDPFQNS